MKFVHLILFLGLPLAAQPPTTITPRTPIVSATVNNNFLGLYNGKAGRWSGAGLPGNVPFSTLGDIYINTSASPPTSYFCARVVACTAVASGNWQLIGSGGGASLPSTTDIIIGDGIGGGVDSKVALTTPASVATLTLGSGKTISIANSLTLTATDGSTLAIGTGGTLGANAFNSTTIPTITGGTCVNQFVRSIGGSAIPVCNTINLASDVTGNLAVARLNSGTAATSATFWRGDGTWATPAGSGTVNVNGGGSLTNTALVTGAGTVLVQTPSATATMDSSGNISTPGTITSGAASGIAGSDDMGAGTAAAVPANSVGFGAPATVTTSQRLLFPNAVTSAHSLMVIGAPTSNVSSFAYKVVPDCQPGVGYINFTQSTDAFGCSSSLPGSTAPGGNTTLTAPAQIYVCTGTCNITIPVPSLNYQFCVYNGDNVSTVITLLGIGSGAMYENQARTGYSTAGTGTIHSGGAVKDSICIIGIDSTHYLFASASGTWTTT